MKEHRVTIGPADADAARKISVTEGEDLLTALRKANIYVKSSCGGHASCSDCLIKITDGIDHLNEPSFDETKLIGNVFHITKERLCCQTMITGDIEIDLSGHDDKADAEKLAVKSKKLFKGRKPGVKVRKPDEIKEVYLDRSEAKKEREERQNSWQNHWEKETGASGRGGSKRPKPFRTDHLDDIDHDKIQEERELAKIAKQKRFEKTGEKSKFEPNKNFKKDYKKD